MNNTQVLVSRVRYEGVGVEEPNFAMLSSRHHVEVDATYVYHTLASDHLPLVCDLVVSE